MGIETVAAIGIPAAMALISELSSKKGGADAGVASANADKLRLMQQAQEQLSQYRPQLAGAEKRAMGDVQSSYQGANNALATMYGGGVTGKLPDPMALSPLADNPAGKQMTGARPMESVSDRSTGASPFAAMRGNGPALGTPSTGNLKSLPDPMQIFGKRPR